MKLTDKEALTEINQHRIIIIAGTTTGRTRIRKLLVENLGQQRIIDTRNYYRNQYLPAIADGHLIEVYSLFNTTKGKEYKVLQIFLNMLAKKKKPLIVDSFTDIQSEIRGEFIRTVGRKVDEHNFQVYDRDWNIYKRMLKETLTKLKKQKKKVILFADLKRAREYKNNVLVDVGEKPVIDKSLIHEADLIIQATDTYNLLIKGREVADKRVEILLSEPPSSGMGTASIIGTTKKVKP